jgi:hypothetical protein
MEKSKWYKDSYRRNLVDMHIEDWSDEFFSKFDAKEYIGMLKLANIQTAMLYANSHVGLCNWPTKTGKMHRNLKGKDIFGEMLDLCHKEDFTTVAYYSGIYNNWAHENYPQWRMIDLEGGHSRDEGKLPGYSNRYGICCPNSVPYVDFVKSQLKELIENYKFNGIFIDMSFWPVVCYCDSCCKRYSNEIGGNIPEQIDWDDPVWTKFQSKRVEWLTEYTFELTDYVKSLNRSISVQHNYTLALYSWLTAVDDMSSKGHDYLGGDRYAGFIDQSFTCKLYYNLTENLPLEYMSSRCQPDLQEHTTIKTKDMLSLHNYLALAHNAAFLFIDAMDPVGTLNRKVYERMGEVFNESKGYEPYLGGKLVEDLAIYFSFNSKMYLKDEKGKSASFYLGDIMKKPIPHLETTIRTTAVLKEGHIPFGIIAEKNIDKLLEYRTVVLSSVDIFNSEEIAAFSDYVKKGGALYISGERSLKYFGDLLGIKYIKQTREKKTYISPTKEGQYLMPEISTKSPLSINGTQSINENTGDVVVLAKTVLPYTNPGDRSAFSKFASIHSDPPGRFTDYPSIILKNIEKGKIIWSSFPIESIDNEPHKTIFLNLIKSLSDEEFSFKSDAPAEVEITLFSQTDNNRYILNLVNLQEKLSILPIYNFSVSVNIKNKKVKEVVLLPYKDKLDYEIVDGWVNIYIDKLDIYKMIAINF